ncbi:ornithine cyclodeaminase family protein [Streptomyces sp. NPDC007875]|uniref:ornithine cyclodeaminase family protein n=1 Tax=Streptomyces sp. NPDC007875 TaxID=3364783 RepID=UPI003690ACBE
MTVDHSLLVLSRTQITGLLDPAASLESQRTAFARLAGGTADLAPRLLLPGPDASVAFCYASRLSPDSGAVCKFGSVNPGNAATGAPSVSATVLVLDPASGTPLALLDGEAITTARTAAATALAAGELARPDATRLAVLGSGVQGRAHLRALTSHLGRRLTELRIWSPRQKNRTDAAARLSDELRRPVVAADTAEAAVTGADIVITCTTSRTPVLDEAWLAPGATVLGVGSFAPDRCEVDDALLRRASAVVVDDPPTAARQAGPVVRALRNGILREEDLVGLGEVVLGRARPRTDDDDIVFYNSVGVGVQDAALAELVLARARPRGAGSRISLV